MANFPYMEFYPTDWIADTRTLTLSAKGAWIDLISAMWSAPERGVLCMRLSAYGRLIGTTEDRMAAILDELTELKTCERENLDDGRIRLTCRRAMRDALRLEEKRKSLSEAGMRGAEKRWGGHAKANGHDMATSSQQPTSINKNTGPSLQEALEHAAAQSPPWEPEAVRAWHANRDGQAWLKGNGLPVHNWQSDLCGWVMVAARDRISKPAKDRVVATSAPFRESPFTLQKRIDAADEQIHILQMDSANFTYVDSQKVMRAEPRAAVKALREKIQQWKKKMTE